MDDDIVLDIFFGDLLKIDEHLVTHELTSMQFDVFLCSQNGN